MRGVVRGVVSAGVDSKLTCLQHARQLPVTEWKASHVMAWLEIDMHMAAYRQQCFDNIKSGKVSYLYHLTYLY